MNENWNHGYVTEVPYTHGYYRELSPSLQRFALLLSGYVPPVEGTYLELGYGQGLSACIHSAATGCQVWGTDFNPVQAAYARGLAQSAGLDAQLFDDSFEQLLAKKNLPEFNFIGAHGIWTWVSNEARRQIVDLLRQRLNVGGVAYFSYNTFPGWSAAYSMRHLLALQASIMGSQNEGVVKRVANAIDFAQGMVDSGALYFKANPQVAERLSKLSQHDKHYLAHEYFNRDWQPMHFSEFAEWMEPAKLDFVASAHLLDHVDVLNLLPLAQEKLDTITQPLLKESMRDYFVNQQFRRDLMMRGPQRLSPLDHREALDACRVMLLVPPDEVSLTVTGTHEVTLQEAIYEPLLELFAAGAYKPLALLDITRAFPQFSWNQLLQAVVVMVGAGHMHPVQDDETILKASRKTAALNAELCRRARGSSDVSYLASPVIGAGVQVNRFEQMFLLCRARGRAQPAEWIADTWAVLKSLSQKIVQDGKKMESDQDNMQALSVYADKFVKRLPILIALGIA